MLLIFHDIHIKLCQRLLRIRLAHRLFHDALHLAFHPVFHQIIYIFKVIIKRFSCDPAPLNQRRDRDLLERSLRLQLDISLYNPFLRISLLHTLFLRQTVVVLV